MIEKEKTYFWQKSKKERLLSRFPKDLALQIMQNIPEDTDDWFWFKCVGKLDNVYIGPHKEDPKQKRKREIQQEIASLLFVPVNSHPHDVDYDYLNTKSEMRIEDLRAELRLLDL